MRVLVADDQLTMRRIIVNLLHNLGIQDCQEAANGEEALKLLVADPIDLLITDWNMPVMNGLLLLRAVRANEQTKDLPVVIITSNDSEQDVIQALKIGVTGYLVKPFTMATFNQRLAHVLSTNVRPHSLSM